MAQRSHRLELLIRDERKHGIVKILHIGVAFAIYVLID